MDEGIAEGDERSKPRMGGSGESGGAYTLEHMRTYQPRAGAIAVQH